MVESIFIAGYYISQIIFLVASGLLVWKRIGLAAVGCFLGFLLFMIGNMEMLNLSKELSEIRQTGGVVESVEYWYTFARGVSAGGLLLASLGFLLYVGRSVQKEERSEPPPV